MFNYDQLLNVEGATMSLFWQGFIVGAILGAVTVVTCVGWLMILLED
jgi:hypothetical protein